MPYYGYMRNTTDTMTARHCSGCAQADPIDDGDGYTDCCNEWICDGTGADRWTVGTLTFDEAGREVRTVTGELLACCGGKADKLAAAQAPGRIALCRN